MQEIILIKRNKFYWMFKRTYSTRCDAIVLEARFSQREKRENLSRISREWNIISALTRESFAIVVARDNWPLMYFLTEQRDGKKHDASIVNQPIGSRFAYTFPHFIPAKCETQIAGNAPSSSRDFLTHNGSLRAHVQSRTRN